MMNVEEMQAGREMDMLVSEMMGGNFRPYSTDIAAAYQMEERIAELGLIEEYCFQLNAIANAHFDRAYYRQPQRWQLIHATPEDRCRAALLARRRDE
jgi:hypothetical protein